MCGSVYKTEMCVCGSVYSTDTEVCVCVYVCFLGEGSGSVYSMEMCVVLVVCKCMSGVSGVSGFGTQLNVRKGVVGA